MKTAYIAGKVSGDKPEKVKLKFNRKERDLLRMGYNVINPVGAIAMENIKRYFGNQPQLNDADTRHLTLRKCVEWLVTCDEIHMLPDWKFSEGARIEHTIAELLKIKIVYC